MRRRPPPTTPTAPATPRPTCGAQVAALARTGKIGTSSRPLIRGGSTAFGEWFGGTMDEVRVYDRALSATEVANDQATPLP